MTKPQETKFEPAGASTKPRGATIYVRFNALVAKSILAKSWRAIPYESVLTDETYLGRWFRKTLALKFTFAAPDKSFNLRLTTIITLSGISPFSRLRDNLAQVKTVLAGLDIVARFSVRLHEQVNPKTARKVMSDATFVIYPSPSFIAAQINSNSHTKTLSRAVCDDRGGAIIEPHRADFKNHLDFVRARKAYLNAQADNIKRAGM